jgi:pimeloyl-ACP methyl ester carboxylesterase
MPLVDSHGVKIHFTVDGEGFPIILQTGAGGDATMWQQAGYVEGLRGFQCILIDHRGHGRSDRPAGLENHAMDCYVRDIIAVLDAVHIERAAFWGYSSGCSVGFALAATHAERVAALIASGAIGARDYSDPEERRHVERRAALVREHRLDDLIAGLEQAEATTFPPWFWRQMVETNPEMFALELLGESTWRGPWSVLHQIRCPVLMLSGELEDPEDNNRRAASILRDAHSVMFQGLGHVGAYLRSDLALTHAMPFLRATCILRPKS